MITYCEKNKIEWAIDASAAMPSEEDLKKIPIEHSPREEKEDEETKDEKKRLTEKQFPFRLRILDLKTNNPIEIKDRLKR